MADLLDQIHAARNPAPAGDLLDQVHAQAAPKSWLDQLTDIPKGLWGNLVQTGQGMVNTATTRPDKTLGDIGRAQDAVRLKAEDAFKKGNYAEGVRHVMGWLIPMAGPGIDASGDKAQAGKWGEAAGEAISQGLQLAGPEALARTVPTPTPPAPGSSVGSRPLIKSTLNPVEQEAVDFLKSRDVPMDVGTQTGNKFVKAAQALAKNQPLGASTAASAARATETGLKRVGGELIDEAHPAPATPESAGAAIQSKMRGVIKDLAPEREAAYQDAWLGRGDPAHTQVVPVRTRRVVDPTDSAKMIDEPVMQPVNMPVDVRGIKEQAVPILDEMSWMPASERASNAGYRALEKIVEGDDFIPAWAAENGLSGLKTMARLTGKSAKSGMRDVGQGIAASLIGELQEGIDAAVAQTGDSAIQGLQRGRATHATMSEIADLAEKLRDEPVQTFNQMKWSHDTGVDFLRKVADHAPDQMPEIGRALLQDLFDRATRGGGFAKTRGLLNEWENLGPKTKTILYPDSALRANIGRFFKAADMVAENPNVSGSAVVGSLIPGGMLMIHEPISGTAWLLSGYAASKLLFSERGVNLLTQGMRPTTPGASSLVARQILNMAGKGATKVALPAMLQQGRPSGQDDRPPLSNFHR